MIPFKQISVLLILLVSFSFNIHADELKSKSVESNSSKHVTDQSWKKSETLKTDSNNSEKCTIEKCDIMKDKVVAMVKEKFNQISSHVEDQKINTTAISLKMEHLLTNLSEENNNSLCITMFTQMMKIPIETFLEYKEKNE